MVLVMLTNTSCAHAHIYNKIDVCNVILPKLITFFYNFSVSLIL